MLVMRGTPPALQIAAENFPPGGDVARSELLKDGHRPSIFMQEKQTYS